MYRVLFRISVLSAAVIIGGTALAAANSTDTAVRTLAAKQMTTDPTICVYIDGVWHCFEQFEGVQGSRRPASSNS